MGFFEKVEVANFEIASDAFTTFKVGAAAPLGRPRGAQRTGRASADRQPAAPRRLAAGPADPPQANGGPVPRGQLPGGEGGRRGPGGERGGGGHSSWASEGAGQRCLLGGPSPAQAQQLGAALARPGCWPAGPSRLRGSRAPAARLPPPAVLRLLQQPAALGELRHAAAVAQGAPPEPPSSPPSRNRWRRCSSPPLADSPAAARLPGVCGSSSTWPPAATQALLLLAGAQPFTPSLTHKRKRARACSCWPRSCWRSQTSR
jgi:hypothetical protein